VAVAKGGWNVAAITTRTEPFSVTAERLAARPRFTEGEAVRLFGAPPWKCARCRKPVVLEGWQADKRPSAMMHLTGRVEDHNAVLALVKSWRAESTQEANQ